MSNYNGDNACDDSDDTEKKREKGPRDVTMSLGP